MNKNKIVALVLILLLIIGVVGWNMSRDGKSLKSENSGDITLNNKKEIKIGIISILSGQYAFVGENLVAGARLYEKEWNEAHKDQKLSLIIEDDSFDAKKGIAAYKKLYEIFANAFKKTYGNIETVKISSDDASAKTLALKLNKENYTDYIVIASPSEGAMSVKHILQTSKSSMHFFLDSSFLTGFTEYQKILGDNIKKLEGSDVLAFKDIPETFKTKYKSFAGKDTGIGSDLGYEGVKALVETMPNVATVNADGKSIINGKNWLGNMQNANLNGVTGAISFDKDGLRTPAFTIKKFVGGEIK